MLDDEGVDALLNGFHDFKMEQRKEQIIQYSIQGDSDDD